MNNECNLNGSHAKRVQCIVQCVQTIKNQREMRKTESVFPLASLAFSLVLLCVSSVRVCFVLFVFNCILGCPYQSEVPCVYGPYPCPIPSPIPIRIPCRHAMLGRARCAVAPDASRAGEAAAMRLLLLLLLLCCCSSCCMC